LLNGVTSRAISILVIFEQPQEVRNAATNALMTNPEVAANFGVH